MRVNCQISQPGKVHTDEKVSQLLNCLRETGPEKGSVNYLSVDLWKQESRQHNEKKLSRDQLKIKMDTLYPIFSIPLVGLLVLLV